MKFLYVPNSITLLLFSAVRGQTKYNMYLSFTSPSRKIFNAQGTREVAAYLQDEMSVTLNHDIAETL